MIHVGAIALAELTRLHVVKYAAERDPEDVRALLDGLAEVVAEARVELEKRESS